MNFIIEPLWKKDNIFLKLFVDLLLRQYETIYTTEVPIYFPKKKSLLTFSLYSKYYIFLI
jgi:hypothetical protein